MAVRALGFLVLLAALPAAAAERFYPVVGPDGRVQMIRSPEAEASSGRGEASAPTGGEAAAAPVVGASAGGEEAALPQPPVAGFAPYDSEQYADSEAVEAAIARERAEKKRFYVIDDGLGNRLSESGSGSEEGALSPVLAQPAPLLVEEPSYPVPSVFRQLPSAEARTRFPALPACLDRPRLAAAATVAPGLPASLVLHRATYTFLEDDRVVEVYRVGGNGPRTLVLRSYSRTDRNPSFAHPHMGFLDENGCLTRVVAGYYEHLFPRTDGRHAMLRGELLVHTEEAYVAVLASRSPAEIAAALPYGYSPYGQLKFVLKK